MITITILFLLITFFSCKKKDFADTMISGKIIDNYTGLPLSNTTVTLSIETSGFLFNHTILKTVLTDADGKYVFEINSNSNSGNFEYKILANKDNNYSQRDTSINRTILDKKNTEIGSIYLGHITWVTVKFFHNIPPINTNDGIDYEFKTENESLGINVSWDNSEFTAGLPSDKKTYLINTTNKNGTQTITKDSMTFDWKKPYNLVVNF